MEIIKTIEVSMYPIQFFLASWAPWSSISHAVGYVVYQGPPVLPKGWIPEAGKW